jgi:hypothetical protein
MELFQEIKEGTPLMRGIEEIRVDLRIKTVRKDEITLQDDASSSYPQPPRGGRRIIGHRGLSQQL